MCSTLLTVCLLMQAAVPAIAYKNTFFYQNNINGKYVELFRPFSLCGMVVKLDIVDDTVTTVQLTDAHCTIGCVNKTRDTFRIGIYTCDGSLANFALPISFTDMDFTVQYTDAQFVAQGELQAHRLNLQLVPNLTCMQRRGAKAICIRVTMYEQSQKAHEGVGALDIGINRSIWTKASMYGDANGRTLSAVLIANSLMIVLLLT